MNTWKKIFTFPSRNLVVVIPLTLLLGFVVGLKFNTAFLKDYLLIATFFMIYPTMIGFKVKEAFDLSHGRVLLVSLVINFVLIPALAYGIGMIFLREDVPMLAGLVLASLLPTSGMTISWTMLNKGNVPAAVKITAISLIAGSLLTPWYLYFLVGKMIPVNVVQTFQTIAVVVFLPLVAGVITHRFLLRRYTPQEFNEKVKPLLPAFSVWAMLLLIFASMSMRARVLLKNPNLLLQALVVLVLFYLLNFALSTLIGRTFFDRGNAVTLVYSTVMRNLSIALGLAVTTFGPNAALLITLAFILQVQGAAWYGRVADRLGFFQRRAVESRS